MRLAAYLCTSRHGIFYFRYPLPADGRSSRKRRHIKVSLGTREPEDARHLSRLLAVAGHSLLARPMVRSMRYDEMRSHVRDHFGQMLQSFRDTTAETGPVNGQDLEVLRGSQGLAQADAAIFAATVHKDGESGLLKEFCEARGIERVPTGEEGRLLLDEFLKGYREYLSQALEHTEQFDTLNLAKGDNTAAQHSPIVEVSSGSEPALDPDE